jgi:putative oxygen-independent coproporphyrinogen III oxidase
MKHELPEDAYVAALLEQLDDHLPLLEGRPFHTIFFGGGTPSLFQPKSIAAILRGAKERTSFASDIEITLEANPGTIDQAYFKDYYQAGINRLSLGVQSLQNAKLQALGRIHDRQHALAAIEIAKKAGFSNFNIDLMFGLPGQTIADALSDLQDALATSPTHLSWYQLTIEPNTFFYHQPPVLPLDDAIYDMQLAGQELLQKAHFHQYEVSAYAQKGHQCRHNRNYWEYGDYLGLGAGAHSKLTLPDNDIIRFAQVKHPKDYLDLEKRRAVKTPSIPVKERIFEFMLNTLRLCDGVPADLFSARTGIPLSAIQPILQHAREKGLLTQEETRIAPSLLGQRFLNELITLFLPDKN